MLYGFLHPMFSFDIPDDSVYLSSTDVEQGCCYTSDKQTDVFPLENYSNESLSTCHSDTSIEPMNNVTIIVEKISENTELGNCLKFPDSTQKKYFIENSMDEESVI